MFCIIPYLEKYVTLYVLDSSCLIVQEIKPLDHTMGKQKWGAVKKSGTFKDNQKKKKIHLFSRWLTHKASNFLFKRVINLSKTFFSLFALSIKSIMSVGPSSYMSSLSQSVVLFYCARVIRLHLSGFRGVNLQWK